MEPKRVLVITPDRVGVQRAGIALRHLEIARALIRHGFDVTLASTDVHSQGIGDEIPFSTVDADSVRGLAENRDAILVQGNVLRLLPVLQRLPIPLIVDLICPVFLENLERYRGRRDAVPRAASDLSLFLDLLAVGDHFICGSPRQRHFWIGMLAAIGRVDPAATEDDPDLDRLIGVVPFGVSDSAPQKQRPVLRGVVPGIEPDDLVLLWSGGLWNWLDPLTPIRAVAAIAEELPRVRLVFTGLQHPQDPEPMTEMGRRARALASELGVLDRNVFFVEGWVPNEDLGDYLLEADIAVSAHGASVETTFAVRTRFWTYLWGGLPVIASGGDWVSETISRDALGVVVPIADVAAFAEAIRELADPDKRRTAAEAVRRRAAAMTWDHTVAPLADLIRSSLRTPRRRRSVPRWIQTRVTPRGQITANLQMFRASMIEDGLPTALRKSWRKLGIALSNPPPVLR